jgi:hypothetical protein
MPIAPINAYLDVTRFGCSVLATHGEVYFKAPATTRPLQLNHIGTVQPVIAAGQPKKIRNTWNSATAAPSLPGGFAHDDACVASARSITVSALNEIAIAIAHLSMPEDSGAL